MDSAEHYEESERLLAEMPSQELDSEVWHALRTLNLAAAAVHAELAAVALEAETRVDWRMGTESKREIKWRAVLGGSR